MVATRILVEGTFADEETEEEFIALPLCTDDCSNYNTSH